MMLRDLIISPADVHHNSPKHLKATRRFVLLGNGFEPWNLWPNADNVAWFRMLLLKAQCIPIGLLVAK